MLLSRLSMHLSSWQVSVLLSESTDGCPSFPQVCHALNLDYDALCQPWRCEQTLTCEKYTHGGSSLMGRTRTAL